MKNKKGLIIGVCALIVMIVAFICIYNIAKPKPSSQNSGQSSQQSAADSGTDNSNASADANTSTDENTESTGSKHITCSL